MLGEMGSTGLKLPKKLDFKGFMSIILQVTGLTEDNIFNRIEKKIGKEKTDKLRAGFEVVKTLLKDGMDGLIKLGQDKLEALLQEIIVNRVIDWVKRKIIKRRC